MIVEIASGNQMDVCFRALTKADIQKYGLTIRNGWLDWERQIKNKDNQGFGMFTVGNTDKDSKVLLPFRKTPTTNPSTLT